MAEDPEFNQSSHKRHHIAYFNLIGHFSLDSARFLERENRLGEGGEEAFMERIPNSPQARGFQINTLP